jgi:hypothetical protein
MALKVGELYATLGLDSKKFDQDLDKSGRSFEGFGSKLMKMGKAAGVAIAAAMVTAVNAGIAQAAGVDKAAASLVLSEAEAARLGKIAGKAYTNNFGESVEANSRVVAEAWRRFGDLGDAALQEVTEGALTLADVFDQDVTGVINAAQQLLVNGLAPDAQSAMDLVGAALRGTKGDTDEIIEALNEYSTNFAQLGLEGPQVLGALTSEFATNQYAIDKVGDSIKEMFLRLGDRSAAEALDTLGLDIDAVNAAFAEGGPAAQVMISQIVAALASVKDPLERTRIGAEIMGAPFEDLGKNALPILQDMVRGVGEVGDVTGEVADQAYDNVQGTLGEAWRSAKQDVVNATEEMGPAIGGIVTTLSDLGKMVLPLVKVGVGAVSWALGRLSEIAKGAVWYLDGLADLFGLSDGRAADMARSQLALTDALNKGIDPAVALANSLAEMARNGELTEDEFKALADQAGVSGDRLEDVKATLLTYAASGKEAEITTRELRDAFGEASNEAASADQKFFDLAAAMNETETAAADVGEETEELSFETTTLAEALDAAREAQESLANVMLEAASPLLAAIGAVDSLKAAQERLTEVQGDTEASASDLAAAEIAVAEALLQAQGRMDELSPEQLNAAIDAIATALGKSTDEVEDLLNQLDVLDGTTVQTFVETHYSSINQPGPNFTARAHGGLVHPAITYRVGEGNRPEMLMIPGDGGRMFSYGDTMRMMQALDAPPTGAGAAQGLSDAAIDRLGDRLVNELKNTKGGATFGDIYAGSNADARDIAAEITWRMLTGGA